MKVIPMIPIFVMWFQGQLESIVVVTDQKQLKAVKPDVNIIYKFSKMIDLKFKLIADSLHDSRQIFSRQSPHLTCLNKSNIPMKWDYLGMRKMLDVTEMGFIVRYVGQFHCISD